MDVLLIELGYLPKLLDVEVDELMRRGADWDLLLHYTALFDLDISHLQDPLQSLPDVIVRKSNELLSKEQAQAFQRVWNSLSFERQKVITYKLWGCC